MAERAAGLPLVSVVLPVRNERDFIADALGAVIKQDYPADRLEVLLVDGSSDDGTPEVARDLLERSGLSYRVIDNPRRIVPVSMNLGIDAARGDVVVRVDGHCEIAPDYVRRCVEVLQRTGAACVGGVCETVSSGSTGRAIALAQSSPFGVGNVAFRTGRSTAGPADTVPFGAFPRSVFTEVGPFDEELVRNQDDEMTFRIAQSGRLVWYDPAIRSTYHSRSDFRRLWRQYHQYGLYKVRVMQKRRGLASPRQAVPALFVTALAGGALASLATRRARWFVVVAAPYVTANALASARVARAHDGDASRVAAAFAILHTAYGSGFIAGLWRWRRYFGTGPTP